MARLTPQQLKEANNIVRRYVTRKQFFANLKKTFRNIKDVSSDDHCKKDNLNK